MTTAKQVLHLAASEIGYKETPTDSNHNKFGVWYGMDYAPWCAMFVSYCFYNNGLPLNIERKEGFAWCPSGVDWFKAKGWWHTQNPQVGDVVFYDWNGDGEAKHVGMVEKVNSDGSIVAIEGNTSVGNDSNGGQVMRRNRDAYIKGYGRPPYTNEDGVDPVPHPVWPGRYIALTSPNMEGADVLLWQRQMIHRGYNLGASGTTGKGDDSIFTKRNHDVLISFQQEKVLEVDGAIGPQSWNAAWDFPVT